MVGGCGDELLARALLLQPMKHTHFSGNNEGTGSAASAEVDHFFSGTNFICQHAHGACAFRMSDQKGIRVFFPDGQNTVSGEFDVGVAVALPQLHGALGLFHHPCAKVFIWHKKKISIFRRGFYDLDCISTGANHITQCFDGCTAIDVRDRVNTRVRLLISLELFCWTTLLQ